MLHEQYTGYRRLNCINKKYKIDRKENKVIYKSLEEKTTENRTQVNISLDKIYIFTCIVMFFLKRKIIVKYVYFNISIW